MSIIISFHLCLSMRLSGSILVMQGNIARWLKKEGEKVSPGEVLCEVETVGLIFFAAVIMMLRECAPFCVLASGLVFMLLIQPP